jgi:hypothetical protein
MTNRQKLNVGSPMSDYVSTFKLWEKSIMKFYISYYIFVI